MNHAHRILVVDDTPINIEVLESLLVPSGYLVSGAASGSEALARVAEAPPDLVLLDLVMPGMDGLEVCKRLRAESETQMIPMVMVTASQDMQRARALEAGADDFLTKPIDRDELLARVRSLLRIKQYHDTMRRQADELASWNATLAQRVDEQVAQLNRMERLRRFLSPQLADLLLSAEGESLLETHRRLIAVVSCQLLGFPGVAETNAPEEVVGLLSEYHEALGGLINEWEGSVGPLVGDRITVFFNDPLPVDHPGRSAVGFAIQLHVRLNKLLQWWSTRGVALDFGIGIDVGYATLSVVGLKGRAEYTAIGTVVHTASALSDLARGGQILTTRRVAADLAPTINTADLGEKSLPGFARPVSIVEVSGGQLLGSLHPPIQPSTLSTATSIGLDPLSEREHEVAALIAQGLSNRQIGEKLIIAEATAVRHVANILSKLGFHSRAQVAVWAVEHRVSV